MIQGFKIICQYLEVLPSPYAFFYLFTLTRSSGRGLTTGWFSFRAYANRKVFLLDEEIFSSLQAILLQGVWSSEYGSVLGDLGRSVEN